MKQRTKWVLLALIAVVAIILVIALLRGCQQDPGKASDPGDETSDEVEETSKPNIDPQSGMELDEDELPIDLA